MAKKRMSMKKRGRPSFQISSAFVGGYSPLNPASVSGMDQGGAAGWEMGKVGTLDQQWAKVMNIGSTTEGNSFDTVSPSAATTPQQLTLAQSGGRRSRRRTRYMGGFQEKPPVVGGGRRSRRRKYRGGFDEEKLQVMEGGRRSRHRKYRGGFDEEKLQVMEGGRRSRHRKYRGGFDEEKLQVMEGGRRSRHRKYRGGFDEEKKPIVGGKKCKCKGMLWGGDEEMGMMGKQVAGTSSKTDRSGM